MSITIAPGWSTAAPAHVIKKQPSHRQLIDAGVTALQQLAASELTLLRHRARGTSLRDLAQIASVSEQTLSLRLLSIYDRLGIAGMKDPASHVAYLLGHYDDRRLTNPAPVSAPVAVQVVKEPYFAAANAARQQQIQQRLSPEACPAHSPNQVCYYRAKANLTRRQLAERIGFSRTYLYRVETGRKPLNATMVTRLAQALGVSVEELQGDK